MPQRNQSRRWEQLRKRSFFQDKAAGHEFGRASMDRSNPPPVSRSTNRGWPWPFSEPWPLLRRLDQRCLRAEDRPVDGNGHEPPATQFLSPTLGVSAVCAGPCDNVRARTGFQVEHVPSPCCPQASRGSTTDQVSLGQVTNSSRADLSFIPPAGWWPWCAQPRLPAADEIARPGHDRLAAEETLGAGWLQRCPQLKDDLRREPKRCPSSGCSGS